MFVQKIDGVLEAAYLMRTSLTDPPAMSVKSQRTELNQGDEREGPGMSANYPGPVLRIPGQWVNELFSSRSASLGSHILSSVAVGFYLRFSAQTKQDIGSHRLGLTSQLLDRCADSLCLSQMHCTTPQATGANGTMAGMGSMYGATRFGVNAPSAGLAADAWVIKFFTLSSWFGVPTGPIVRGKEMWPLQPR